LTQEFQRDLTLARLRDVADLYRQLAAARHDLSDSARRERDLAELDAEYVGDLAATGDDLRRRRQQASRFEDELKNLEDKLQDRRSRQAGDAATVLALAGEIASLRRRRDELEKKLLDLWQSGETAAAALAEETRQTDDQRQAIADRRRDHAESAVRAGRAVPEIEGELGHLVGQLPTKVGRRLKQVARRHADPVADLVAGNCGSCGQSLPPQEAVDADREAALIVCQGCGRYVVARSSRRTRGRG